MSPNPVTASLAALYGRTPSERIAELADAADGAVAAVEQLRRDPSADRAERLAILFGGAQRSAARLSHQLAAAHREGRGDG